MGQQFQIFADENIALVDDFFSEFGTVHRFSGKDLQPHNIALADVLLVRSVTPVSRYLISHCKALKFVGSATTGTDHVDLQALQGRNVHFSHAPGSNAQSVVEYVMSVFANHYSSVRELSGLTVGIVGLGTIGSRLARALKAMGCRVIANDPPLELSNGSTVAVPFVDLETIMQESDVISLHVPLIDESPFPTRNLIDKRLAKQIERGTLFINTSRGQTVTAEALETMNQREVVTALDVWPDEPKPEQDLVRSAAIATPHIAGYSYDGKIAGTRMLRDALVSKLGLTESGEGIISELKHQVLSLDEQESTGKGELMHAIRMMYDVREDDHRFRKAYLTTEENKRADAFSRLRKNYPVRRSFDAFEFETGRFKPATERLLIQALGMRRSISE